MKHLVYFGALLALLVLAVLLASLGQAGMAAALLFCAAILGHGLSLLRVSDQKWLLSGGPAALARHADAVAMLAVLATYFGAAIALPAGAALFGLGLGAALALGLCYGAVRMISEFKASRAPIATFALPEAPGDVGRVGMRLAYLMRIAGATVSLVALVAIALGATPGAVAAMAGFVLAVLSLAVVAVAVVTVRLVGRLELETQDVQLALVRTRLAELAPEIVLYYSAPFSPTHKTLEKTITDLRAGGRPFFVLLRERQVFERFRKRGQSNIVLAERMGLLDGLVVPSVKLALYLNDGEKNGHFVRFNQMDHVILAKAANERDGALPQTFAMYGGIIAPNAELAARWRAQSRSDVAGRVLHLSPPPARVARKIPLLPRAHLFEPDGSRSLGWRISAPQIGGLRDWAPLQRWGKVLLDKALANEVPKLRLNVVLDAIGPSDRNGRGVQADLLKAMNKAPSLPSAFGRPRIDIMKTSVENCYNWSDILLCSAEEDIPALLATGKPVIVYDILGQVDSEAPADGSYRLAADLGNFAALLTEIAAAKAAPVRARPAAEPAALDAAEAPQFFSAAEVALHAVAEGGMAVLIERLAKRRRGAPLLQEVRWQNALG